jgi:hypothetical protein
MQLNNGVREAKLSGVHVHGADRRGFSLGSTDCQIAYCTAGSSGEEGFVIGGGNNHLAICKTFSAGRIVNASSGFSITAGNDRNELTACEAQDNGLHGFLIASDDNILSACMADSNGISSAGASGFRLDAATGNVIQGRSRNRSGKTTQEYGLTLASGADNNTFTGDLSGNNTSPWLITATGKNTVTITGSNSVTSSIATPNVNGIKYLELTVGSATTITNFLEGHEGQEIIITFGDNNSTFNFLGNPNMTGNQAVDLLMKTGDMVRATLLGGKWRCLIVDSSP